MQRRASERVEYIRELDIVAYVISRQRNCPSCHAKSGVFFYEIKNICIYIYLYMKLFDFNK